MAYRYSKAVHDHFISEEGFKTKAYKDTVGLWTIGVGHLLGASNVYKDTVWSQEKCLQVLEDDIDNAYDDAKSIFPEYNELPTNVQLAVLDMLFNMGGPTFRQFKNTIRLIHAGKYEEAAASAAASKWARQVPNRAKRTLKLLSNT